MTWTLLFSASQSGMRPYVP
ncbi:hypothetical protein AVEN_86163-1, partial [Araneus ventricosus]